MNKMARLTIQDNIYNWIKALFKELACIFTVRDIPGMLNGCSGEKAKFHWDQFLVLPRIKCYEEVANYL